MYWNEQRNPGGAIKRWRKSGVSIDTALNLCRKITKEMTIFFNMMIDLKFDPNIVSDRMEFDYENLIQEYREKIGMLKK